MMAHRILDALAALALSRLCYRARQEEGAFARSERIMMNSNDASGELTLLGVFAHPDDEQGVGGVFTRAVREYGAKAYIVSVTSGQAGQISDPALATPENLGEVREQELRDAVALYGWEPPILLRYPDGGVADLPPRQLRDDLVKIIRELKPQVLVTFEKTGIYGHVDHIAVHFETFAAFEADGGSAMASATGRIGYDKKKNVTRKLLIIYQSSFFMLFL